MITIILFDFYGVFTTDPYAAWLEANNLVREGPYLRLAEQLDAGEIDRPMFLNRLSEIAGRRVLNDELYKVNTSINQEVLEIAIDLKQHYSLSLFSNASLELRSKLRHTPMDSLFDHIFLSSEIMLRKPQLEAFAFVINTLNIPAEQILFIDDNFENINAGRKVGMTSIIYTSALELQQSLATLGISK